MGQGLASKTYPVYPIRRAFDLDPPWPQPFGLLSVGFRLIRLSLANCGHFLRELRGNKNLISQFPFPHLF